MSHHFSVQGFSLSTPCPLSSILWICTSCLLMAILCLSSSPVPILHCGNKSLFSMYIRGFLLIFPLFASPLLSSTVVSSHSLLKVTEHIVYPFVLCMSLSTIFSLFLGLMYWNVLLLQDHFGHSFQHPPY